MKDKKLIGVVLGTICAMLTFSIVVQVKTIDNASNIAGTSTKEDSLRDEVLKVKEKYDITYAELENKEKELEKLRENATKNDAESASKEQELKEANMLLGLTDLKGSGAVVTLSDNPNVTKESISSFDNISLYLVHDEDLRVIVNELKNAGAEAISINDQRIVANTSITCNGNVVLINGEKVGSPFIINVIGSSERILGALNRPGGYIEQLNSTGVIATIKKSDNIIVPKYNGVFDYKYVKSIE